MSEKNIYSCNSSNSPVFVKLQNLQVRMMIASALGREIWKLHSVNRKTGYREIQTIFLLPDHTFFSMFAFLLTLNIQSSSYFPICGLLHGNRYSVKIVFHCAAMLLWRFPSIIVSTNLAMILSTTVPLHLQ